MKTLTDDGSSFVAQRCPENGDAVNGPNMELVLQDAANRARYLLLNVAIVQNVLDNTGVTKTRRVTSSANLKALTGMATGDIAMITPASVSTMGLYTFLAGAPLGADITNWAYDANDSSGYWIRDIGPLMTLGGLGGAQPRLQTSVIRVPNSILANAHKGWLTSTVPMTFDGSGGTDTALVSHNLSGLQQNDQVTVHFSAGGIAPNTANGAGIVLAYSTDGGSSYTEIDTSRADVVLNPLPATTRRFPVSVAGQFVLGLGHTQARFMVRGKGSNGDTATLHGPFAMTILATRP